MPLFIAWTPPPFFAGRSARVAIASRSMKTDRRAVLAATAGLAAIDPTLAGALAQSATPSAQSRPDVVLAGDTAFASPDEFARALAAMTSNTDGDRYLQGGAVEALESAFATLLGKEACLFLPTGSLANHLAVKTLCVSNPRALCLYDSHIFRDERDSLPTLGEVALVPFAKGQTAPSEAELDEAFNIALKGPRPVDVGAITLESPIRRLDGQMIPPADIARIAERAKANGTGLHLDGARLLLAPPGFDIAAYAQPFDTVYVSLYKYLGAPFGAVLAGSPEIIAQVREQAGIYGGQIFQGWMAALPALKGLETFRSDYVKAWERGEALRAALQAKGYAFARPIGPVGTNVHTLMVSEDKAQAIIAKGESAGVYLRGWKEGGLTIQINTSILNRDVAEIAAIFEV